MARNCPIIARICGQNNGNAANATTTNDGRQPTFAAIHTEPAAKRGSDNDSTVFAPPSPPASAAFGCAAPIHSHKPNVLNNKDAAIGTE